MKAFNYFPPNQQVYLGHCETRANVQKRFSAEGRSPTTSWLRYIRGGLLTGFELNLQCRRALSESVSNKHLSDLRIVSSSYLKNILINMSDG